MERRRIVDLAFLPTAGIIYVPEEGWLPTESGMMRIAELATAYLDGEVRAVAIVGGRRICILSEAEVYAKYMRQVFPEASDAIVLVDAKEVCTNRDLPAAMPEVEHYLASRGFHFPIEATVAAVSYQEHFDRIKIVLEYLGFSEPVFLDSGEEPAYSPRVENLLTRITKRDPEWRWLGFPFALLARLRLNQQAPKE